MVVVLPGDSVAAVGDLPADAVLRVGPGLRRDGSELVATKAGVPRNRKSTVHWLETSQRRVRARTPLALGARLTRRCSMCRLRKRRSLAL